MTTHTYTTLYPEQTPPECWSEAETKHLRNTAFAMLGEHWQHSNRLSERRECGACVLTKRDGTDKHAPPNYAGWLRVYIQIHRTVPQTWFDAELSEAQADNQLYHDAILRDIATFGITLTD